MKGVNTKQAVIDLRNLVELELCAVTGLRPNQGESSVAWRTRLHEAARCYAMARPDEEREPVMKRELAKCTTDEERQFLEWETERWDDWDSISEDTRLWWHVAQNKMDEGKRIPTFPKMLVTKEAYTAMMVVAHVDLGTSDLIDKTLHDAIIADDSPKVNAIIANWGKHGNDNHT